MGRALTSFLACALAFGGAVAAVGALGAPRQGDERTMALDVRVPPRAAAALPPRRVAVADPNRDGIVTRAEAARYYEARFALIDRDRDGRLSGREFLRSAAAQLRARRGNSSASTFGLAAVDTPRAPAPGAWLRAGAWRRAWPSGAAAGAERRVIFDLLDADRDGVLGKQEFTKAGAEDFAASDADGDGKVAIREFYGGKRL